jgi:hypothetical protein
MRPISIGIDMWQVVEGEGEISNGRVVLSGANRMGWAAAAAQFQSPIAVKGLEAIRLRVIEPGGAVGITVGIAAPNALPAFVDHPVRLDKAGWIQLPLSALFFQGDELGYVVVRARGGLEPELAFEQAELILARPGFFQLQAWLFRQVVNRDDWSQRSVNHQIPDNSALGVAVIPAVVLWIAMALSMYWLLFVRSLEMRPMLVPVLVLVVLGWFALDVVWQVRLSSNHVRSISMYWGKTADEKRLAGHDGAVYELVMKVKEELKDTDRRLIIFGGSQYSHLRARFFAVPQPVISREGLDVAWLRRARSGDVIALVNLSDSLVEKPIMAPGLAKDYAEPERWDLANVVGQNTEVFDQHGQAHVRILDGVHPRLLDLGWHSLAAGAWTLEVEFAAEALQGWVRLEILARDVRKQDSQLIASREVLARQDGLRIFSVPFVFEGNAQINIQARELNARGIYVSDVRVVPQQLTGASVLLSTDGEPPFWIGRQLAKTEGGVAYELL